MCPSNWSPSPGLAPVPGAEPHLSQRKCSPFPVPSLPWSKRDMRESSWLIRCRWSIKGTGQLKGHHGQDSKGNPVGSNPAERSQGTPVVPNCTMSPGQKSPRPALVLVPCLCHSGFPFLTIHYSASIYRAPTPGPKEHSALATSLRPEARWRWLCHLSSTELRRDFLPPTMHTWKGKGSWWHGGCSTRPLLPPVRPGLPAAMASPPPPPLSQGPSFLWLILTSQDPCP